MNCKHRVRCLMVDARGGLVQNEDVGARRQRPGDEHPLLLAAGKLGKPLPGKLVGPGGGEALPREGALGRPGRNGRAGPGRTCPSGQRQSPVSR